jgi:hypothetical protein
MFIKVLRLAILNNLYMPGKQTHTVLADLVTAIVLSLFSKVAPIAKLQSSQVEVHGWWS